MIEKYIHTEQGYNPFLIRSGWQVAQLNYVPTHGLDDIDSIECHYATDEVFILFAGRAVLLSAEVDGNSIKFNVLNMECGVTYNVPRGLWHNIAMDIDAHIVIVENDNTHLNDVAYMELSTEQRNHAYRLIEEALM